MLERASDRFPSAETHFSECWNVNNTTKKFGRVGGAAFSRNGHDTPDIACQITVRVGLAGSGCRRRGAQNRENGVCRSPAVLQSCWDVVERNLSF